MGIGDWVLKKILIRFLCSKLYIEINAKKTKRENTIKVINEGSKKTFSMSEDKDYKSFLKLNKIFLSNNSNEIKNLISLKRNVSIKNHPKTYKENVGENISSSSIVKVIEPYLIKKFKNKDN